ncbi:protein transport protein Sec24p [[Candida] anglica]|uniref:Protein transport protein Sec24p n=1 Tax=[Candida] anglica TaxID=148631 RepID=A0ABP0EI12_9ASCO
MSNRRRAYPQPQYSAASGAPPAGFVAGVSPYGGVDQLGQQFQNLQVGAPGIAPGVAPGANGASGIPPAGANAYQYGQPAGVQPQAQVPVQQPYQQQQQPGQGYDYTAGYNAPTNGYQAQGAAGAAYGASGYGQTPALPLNQLYTADLLKELPPSISDLSLPPPPLVLPANSALVPTSESSNASPEYFRSTMNVIPNNNSLAKKSKLPMALVVRPYNALKIEDENVPVTSDTIISRCRRCRGYINPFVTLTEQGRRWRCNFCNLLNDIPSSFEYDEVSGTSKNKFSRVELNHSVVEFVAPKEYMARSPQPIVYTFIIDVSIEAVSTGLTGTITRTILESLDRIPNQNNTARVAFIGVDSSLHYFRFNEGLEGTEVLIVSDIDEPFLPSPDGLLVNLNENRPAIEKLLVDFPSYFENTANNKFALGPALRAAHKMISNIGGKLVCFAASLPNIGEGKLQAREDPNVSGKAKESQLLSAADSFYKSFAVECNSAQVTVDLFLTSGKYQDVASLSNLPRFTAGQTHFYPAWTSGKMEDVTKLSKEVSDHLSMDIALEAVLRVRGSTGLRMSSFYGNFFNRSSDLCSFPTFPRDQSYVIEMSIEENIAKPVVYFQAAVLHSTCFGERRIRVMNLAIPTSSKLDDIYASADQLAITNYYTHKAIEKAISSSLADARDYLSKSLIDILNVYKKELVAGNVAGSSPLQLSTNLRMLPLLLFSLTKHLGFRNDRVPSDLRSNALNALGSLPIPHLIKYIYPTVYSLHNMDDGCGLPEQIVNVDEETGEEVTTTSTEILLPEPMNDTRSGWENYGLYLIDNSTELFLWVSGDVVPGLVYDLFGTDNLYEVPTGKTELPEYSFEESEFNYRVRQIIGKIRENPDSITWKNLYVVIGGSSNEPIEITNQRDLQALRMWALSCLIEDKTQNEQGYREFLSALKTKVSQ